MKFDLSREVIQQGRITQNKAKETPNAFAVEDGAAVVSPTQAMAVGSGDRMAGQVGNRAFTMMNDPAEAQRTQQWMELFQMSPTAMDNGWTPPPPMEEPMPPAG